MNFKKWKINYYQTLFGKDLIAKFIDDLDEKSQARVYYSFELLSEFGTSLGLPHVKKIKSLDIWELRILGRRSIRFFYFVKREYEFVILHGFCKKTQKTPKKELKTAKQRLANIAKL